MSLSRSYAEATRRAGSVWASILDRVRKAPSGGPTVVVGLGLGHLVVAGWNFNREIQELSVELGPLLAMLLVGTVALLVCLVGYWLWRSQFSPPQRWLVAAGCAVGALVLGTIVYLSILIRLTEGRTVSEPIFVLSLASSQGALAGSIVAILYARARQEAAAARRRRDQIEFVTGILRHDVLNSMTVIRSRAAMLEAGETDQVTEFAEAIVGRSEKVIDLSERVDDVVSVMASDESLQRKPIALRPVVRDQIAALQSRTDDVTIEHEVADVEVLADELLAEVVGNLIENALDHGLDGAGTITLTTERLDDRVRLRVADTGTGVPDDRKTQIFERGASSGGGGFGLFFIETVLDHYGGDIWVEDRADGESGAVFVVELDAA